MVRKAFLLTLTVGNGELWATEVSEVLNWEGPSMEEIIGLISIAEVGCERNVAAENGCPETPRAKANDL